jgi:DNA-binding NarL/FixJ family response regulator
MPELAANSRAKQDEWYLLFADKAVRIARKEHGSAMNSRQIVRDHAADTRNRPLDSGPILVVSVLDGGMKHASVRRRLRTTLSALDDTQDEGVLLLDAAGKIEFASGSARRILSECLDMPAARLPELIAKWHASARGTIVIATDGSMLIVEATEDGSALLLSEQSSSMAMLTARERDVMRCVEEGLSNTQIARRLWIQPTTVRKHLEHIYDKLEVRSRTAALSKLQAIRAEAS